MKEATFTTETVRSVRYLGGFAYKIPDAPITKEIVKITRFTSARPFDITAAVDGIPVAIETKQFKKWKALSKRDFRDEQLTGMSDFIKNGKGRAFVFLNIRINVKGEHENRLLIFDWATLYPRLMQGCVGVREIRERAFYTSSLVDIPDQEGKIRRKPVFDLTEWQMLL